jgi:hypothetical protein
MSKIKKSVVVVMTSAALVAPAVAASPAAADQQNGLVNIHVQNLLNNNQVVAFQNVSIPVAANICGINANVLSLQLASGNNVKCVALANSKQTAWVSYR